MKKTFVILMGFIALFTLGACNQQTTVMTTTLPPADIENVYDIANVSELLAIEPHRSYRLVADIDLSGIEWVPIGTYTDAYRGIFDGNGHSISNMTITQRNDHLNGLFAHVSGVVKNLDILDYAITYSTSFLTYAGGVCGYLSGNIENVHVTGAIDITNTASNSFVGLLVGMSAAKVTQSMTAPEFVANRIEKTSASGTLNVDGDNFTYVGGLVGKVNNTIINKNEVDVAITGFSRTYRIYAGGLIGYHYGGILAGFEASVDDVTIPVSKNLVRADINLTASGIKGSIGGFMGYSHYGLIEDNVIKADLNLAGITLHASMLIAEVWHGSLSSNASAGTMTIVLRTPQERVVSSLFAFKNETTTMEDCYYLIDTSETLFEPVGTLATLANLQDASWYEGWLDWTGFLTMDAAANLFLDDSE
jgi:hypothetical protein